MKKDPKSRALEVCLLRLQGGDSINQVLSAYPRWISTLQPLLEAAKAAQDLAESIQIPADAQRYSQEKFLGSAQEMIPRKVQPPWGKIIRRGMTIMLLLLLAGLGAWQIVHFSAPALPGELLYPIKRLGEQIQRSLETDPGRRLSIELAQDQERIKEIDALIDAGRSGEVAFSGGLSEMSTNGWLVSGITILVPGDARIVGEITPGIHVNIQGTLGEDGVVVARQIQPVEYILQGQVQSIDIFYWRVEGVIIFVEPGTVLQGKPQIGDQVRATLQLNLDERLVARLIELVSR